MKATDLKTVLMKCISANFPVLLKGAPGVGKTDLCLQVAKDSKRQSITVIPAISDPTDAKGIPGKDNGHYEWMLCGDARRIIEAKKPTLVLIDDLGQAAPMVQAAYMQWLLLRRIGEHDVPDCVTFIAATNRREDRAGVSGVLEPVKSRFVTILQLDVDTDDWIKWAFDNDMPSEIIGFVHFRPSMLTQHTPTSDIVNGPCPRTMAHAGELLKVGLDDLETLSGAIGEGAAAELFGFIRVFRSLPNIAGILTDPDGATVPDEPAALYATVSALVERVTSDNAGRILKYAERLPAEFSVLLARDAIRKDSDIQNTNAFIQWATKHQSALM